jgi:4-diphosphocytidyl-2-C-methyl-D-erythritol kinase
MSPWPAKADGPEEIWPAPAKINLFLHVLGRRDDGYHDLQTAFQFLDYGDDLSFSLRPDGEIRRAGGVPGLDESRDMVVRAASLLRSVIGDRGGVDIRVVKRTPVGGGLGGGSSDAATTLVALNRLWGGGLDVGVLAGLGSSLGADVPVFVHGRSAWAQGVGDLLTPVDFPEKWYLVVYPGVSVPTAEIFAAPELTRNSPPIKISRFLSGGGRNDCVGVVRARYAEVGRALEWLGGFGEARMTGTGACIFAAFDEDERAQAVLREVPPEWRGFVARGLNRSPLLDRV